MRRRITGLLLAALVALGTLPTAALAGGPYPASYDLRGEGAVTPARNQGRYGDCWAFAAMAALESAILKQGVDASVTAATLDLSEDHMDRHHGYGYGPRLVGGRYELALSYLLRGDGPYWESDYPYELPAEATAPTSSGGDLHVPAEATPSNPTIPYQVLGVQFLENVDALNLTADTVQAAIAPTKEAIMTYGAVSTNLYQAHDGRGTFPYTNTSYYNPDTAAYYCDGKVSGYNHVANHAVAIVGWDDTFSKDKFTTKPTIDGAWLCKDAQGTGFGQDGFYWVSYQSACVTTTQFCFTQVAKADQAYSGIAQHDALGLTRFVDNSYSGLISGQDVYFNRFTAPEGGTTLEAAGFYTMGKNASYKLYFIPNFEEFSGFFQGDWEGPIFQDVADTYLVKSGSLEQAGYQTIPFDQTIPLAPGQDYALGLWIDFNSPISYMPWTNSNPENRSSGHYVFESNCSVNPAAQPTVGAGETYVFDPYDDSWDSGVFNGMSDGNTIEDVGYTDEAYGVITFGNLCLKGYYEAGTAPTEVAVVSVTQPQGLAVPYGTEASALGLPSTVEAGLSGGGTTALNVAWDTSSYRPDSPGAQILTGTLSVGEGITNPQNLAAFITVTVGEPAAQTAAVTSVTQPQGLAVPYGTEASALGLPSTVEAGLSGGGTTALNVTWDTSSYRPDSPGAQILTGTLSVGEGITNPQNLIASITVTVGEPAVQTLPAPTISPNGGAFTGSQTVTLACAQAGAEIYYTLDGAQPTRDAARYTGPFSLTQTATVRAFAVLEGWGDSPAVSAQFTRESGGTGGNPGGGGTGGGGTGGGSSSEDSTPPATTTRNPDGSTTTTATRQDGTKVTTTKRPDGSQQVVETARDGTVTTTATDRSGNRTETVARPDGSGQTVVTSTDGSGSTTTVSAGGVVTARATLSRDAVAAAQAAGRPAALPMPEVSVTTDRANASAVTVALPDQTAVRVEIPVEQVTPGTVAVLVGADGAQEVLKTSLTTEKGVAVTLSDGDTVKIVDNSKTFTDVPASHWGAEAVAFAASREIFSGTGEATFAPDSPMTRGMIVTVLARYDRVDTSAGASWYAAGAAWAVEQGISDGANLDQSLTREQLATMLYRYAQSQGYDTAGSGAAAQTFADFHRVSDFAVEAMDWAVDAGLITGTGPDTLDPQGQASRAQVAAILMRFVALQQA